MFRRFWIQPPVDYNPDHGRFSQNCVRFQEADDLSGVTVPTYAIPPSFLVHIDLDTVWAWFDDVRMLSNTMRFTPASEF